MFENKFRLVNPLKSWHIDNKVKLWTQNKCWNWRQKRVLSILNRSKYDLLDCYLNPSTAVELRKKPKSNKIGSILKMYLKDGNPVNEIMNETEMLRNLKATSSERSIT